MLEEALGERVRGDLTADEDGIEVRKWKGNRRDPQGEWERAPKR